MRRNNNNRKKNPRKLRKRRRRPVNTDTRCIIGMTIPRWVNSKSYAGEVMITMKLPGLPVLYSTTVTTGVIASAYVIQGDMIDNWNSRFGATFQFFMIKSVKFIIEPLTVSTGYTVFYPLGQGAGSIVPSATDASVAQPQLLLPNSSSAPNSKGVVIWRPTRLEEFEWDRTNNTSLDKGYLCIYTSAANYGAPIVATSLWMIRPIVEVMFRGFEV